ncbi:MAG: ATP-dependent helicase [Fibrobacteria bacterium]|nr:ATP-dependent helicase [Fibrobacteria bacterium]
MPVPEKAPLALPVLAARPAILAALEKTGALVLSAPPGTGKSTQVPRFLLQDKGSASGQILVLQPRRIAARALAARIADEMGEPLGKTVGYQVRFESVAGPDTRILFQTYGTFRQRLMRDPELRGVHTVILDEFHERAWEADLALLWCRALGERRPDLRLVVMSATLDETGLAGYLPRAETVKVEGRAYPVEILHQPPRLNEPLPAQVLRALKDVHARQAGSVLVFLPGAGEIKWCGDALAAWCREAGLRLCELHGSMPLEAQQAALRAPEREPTVILSTNVAETSLTVPGITAVIDAGLHRVASYDGERDLNTLYLQTIAKANAVQRSGRAGRVSAGVCVRLWDTMRESVMADHLEPEIRRVELSEPALAWHALGADGGSGPASSLQWPTPPLPGRWERAEEKLARIGALRNGAITPLGKSLLSWPASPELSRVLHDAAESGDAALKRQVAAMAAALSAGKRGGGPGKNIADLYLLAEDLAAEPRHGTAGADREVAGAFRQFLDLLNKRRGTAETPEDPRAYATKLFLPVYVHRLAAREGTGAFVLADGRKGVAAAPAATRLVLALEIHESGGKDRAKQTTVPLFLPVEPTWVAEVFPDECVWETAEEFDDKKGQLRKEERLMFRGLVLERREKTVSRGADASEVLIEKLRSGEITLPFDDEAWQWVYRIRLAHKACPESGMPELNVDDWDLIYHEVCAGKKSLKQLQDVKVWVALRDYLGPALTAFLEREAPTSLKLPGPKRGKITYFEKTPPEVSARLGDFVGMQGRCKILMGRVDVTYDILAPNYRTVQKTSDLTAFWKGSYAEIRKELKRRYPKHPWPDVGAG